MTSGATRASRDSVHLYGMVDLLKLELPIEKQSIQTYLVSRAAKTFLCISSGAESSNLKCLADKWSNLQFLSMGSDSEFLNPNFRIRSQIPTFCPYNGKHADQ